MKRGSNPVAAVEAGSADTHPLVSLPPHLRRQAFQLKVIWYGPVSRVRSMTEPKRFKVSASIQIEGEVTAEELRELFLPAERLGGRVTLSVPQEPQVAEVDREREKEARKRLLDEKARNLIEAYRAKMGEPVKDLYSSLVHHWIEEFPDEALRQAFQLTAAEPRLNSARDRYEYLKNLLRDWRREEKWKAPGVRT